MASEAVVVKDDLYWVGAFDPGLRVFDVVMSTPFGTTYNSFVLKGRNANVLFETVKEEALDQFDKNLNAVLKPGETIDYVVLNHSEPDHSGALNRVMERFPNATIIATCYAQRNIERICSRKFPKIISISPDNLPVIDIGGYTLHFLICPFLHWPDTMITYIPELKTIITCDFFGAHNCSKLIFSDLIDKDPKMKQAMMTSYKHYFDCILSPFKKYVIQALDRLSELEFDTICCSHGPVLRNDLDHYISLYREWSQPSSSCKAPLVVIAYVSAYHFTKMLADEISEAIEASGLRVVQFDMVNTDVDSVMTTINEARGLLIGTPTLVGEAPLPIWNVVTRLNPIVNAGLSLGVFGSYGWSGEALRNIQGRFSQLTATMNVPLCPFGVVFKPSDEDLSKAKTWGSEFALAVKNNAEDVIHHKEEADPGCSKLEKPPVMRIGTRTPKDNRMKRWKCLVCGEIILSIDSPEVCPVCGATGEDAFIIVGFVCDGITVHPPSFCSINGAEDRRIVIVGSGAAGFNAAKCIREYCKDCGIVMISSENVMPYNRLLIPNLVADEEIKDAPEFKLAEDSWYAENNVKLLLNATVTSVDVCRHVISVNSDSGTKDMQFTKLILATGGINFMPAEGLSARNVFGVRSLAEMERLLTFVKDSPDEGRNLRIVIIGGGLAALEVAQSFKLASFKHVDIIEMKPRILPIQLTEESSAVFRKAIEEQQVTLHLGVTAKVFNRDKTEERVTSIELSSGETIPLDVLCFAIGTKQETTLAAKIGCKVERGIVVDPSMRTTVPDVLACGDCAQFDKVCVANWMEAVTEGRIAGFNALIDDPNALKTYVRQPAPYFLNAFGGAFSVGKFNECSHKMVMRDIPCSENHIELFFDDGNVLVGAIAVGPEVTQKLQSLLSSQVHFNGILSNVLNRIAQSLS